LSVKVTGDLAFLSTVAGKENMPGHWCLWCMLSPAEWSVEIHRPREKWTIDKMISLRHDINEDSERGIRHEPSHIKGCTALPLWDAVPIDDFIVPVLHCLIGMGNRLFNDIFE
jgi:hypothetical protein